MGTSNSGCMTLRSVLDTQYSFIRSKRRSGLERTVNESAFSDPLMSTLAILFRPPTAVTAQLGLASFALFVGLGAPNYDSVALLDRMLLNLEDQGV